MKEKLEEIKQEYSHSDDNSLLAALEMADKAFQAGRDSYHEELQKTGAYKISRLNALKELEESLGIERFGSWNEHRSLVLEKIKEIRDEKDI